MTLVQKQLQKVYRHTSNNSASAGLLGTVSFSEYVDTTATPGVRYYYWVKAVSGSIESEFSFSSTSGWRALLAPSNLTASNGTYTDKICVEWAQVTGATSYKVYRYTSNNSTSAELLGTVSTLQYDDTTASPGTTYYYWVKASCATGDSAFSSATSGWRTLLAPSGVTASNGTYTNKTRVAWTQVTGAASYKVYRSKFNDSTSATFLDTVSGLQCDDTTASPCLIYYYWVKASCANGDSAFSSVASGWRAFSVPSNVIASSGMYTNKIHISWSSVLGATSYKIYRNIANNNVGATLIETVDSPTVQYDDFTVTPDVMYYYWIKASNGTVAFDSAFSLSASGWRAILPAPENVTASNDDQDRVRVEWSSVLGATSYIIYRGLNGPSEIIGTVDSPDLHYDDATAMITMTFRYYVRATTSTSTFGGVFSAPASGCRPWIVVASQGTYTDMIQVDWSSGFGSIINPEAQCYLFRSLDMLSWDILAVTSDLESEYNDTSAFPGVTYYYKVALGLGGPRIEPAEPVIGWRALLSPNNAAASTGSYTDKISVNWSLVTGATSYKVYRNTVNDSSTASLVAAVSTVQYDDTTAEPSVNYFYWITASCDNGDSAFCSAAQGWLTITETQTAPRPVPHSWLDQIYPGNNGDYEALANDFAPNGYYVWESYVAGLNPTNPASRFGAYLYFLNGDPVIVWKPDLGVMRKYTIWYNATLDAKGWTTTPDANARFFKVNVDLQ